MTGGGSHPSTLGYRPHLDGLRALAVLLVIAFHFRVPAFAGGFIGVDVFFVLSGYLITSLLLAEVATEGRVRLARFYARRARRLLPASIVVLVATGVGAAVLLDAVDRYGISGDITASALFSANWRFAVLRNDYFAPGDSASPLRHYWSLGVEEQFYVVWPVLVWGAWRLVGRRARSQSVGLLAVLVPLGIASAAASVVLEPSPVTYFGTHTRAYQLVAGAVLAVVAARGSRKAGARQWSSRRAGAAGLASLAALLWLSHDVDGAAYPGVAALAVTGASVLLVASLDLGGMGVLQRAFGCAPAALIGRLSYSLYLWHWPVAVLAPRAADRYDVALLTNRWIQVGLTAALASASYLLVERPIRFGLGPRAAPRWVLAPAAVAVAAVVLVAATWIKPQGALADAAYAAVRDLAKPGDCPYFADDWPDPDASDPCVRRRGAGMVVAYVGDSHAQQWQPALDRLANERDWTLVRLTRGGCPANDITPYHLSEDGRTEPDDECAAWRHETYPELIERHDPDLVMVATRSHVLGLHIDGADIGPTDGRHAALWEDGWRWTLDTLRAGGADVVVSRILPTLPERVPACLMARGLGGGCDFDVAADRRVSPYNTAIARVVGATAGASVLDPTPMVCPRGRCEAVVDGVIVHRDDNHVSASYVRAVTDEFAALLDRAASRARRARE